MKKYAQIIDGVVHFIITLTDDDDVTELYHPDFTKALVTCHEEVEEGWLYDGKTFKAPVAIMPNLSIIQSTLKQRIDQNAESERLKYITDGVGQSLTYQEKVNQAANYSKLYAAYLSDPENIKVPNPNEYLLLQASIGIDGETLAEVAENITWAYALWEKVGAAIETIRLQTKAAIDNAKTVKEAQAIFDAIKWPE